MNTLYYEDQQLPDLDDIGYMSGTAAPLQCKADDDVSTAFVFDDDVLHRALKHIYEKDFHPLTDIEESLFDETFRIFTEAATEGLSESSAEILPEFRQKLEQGNAVFSAFKVHRMQNDIAARLYDSNNVLKPFEQWKKDVHPMLDHHVRHWLKTEYDTAVIRSRQAADWQRFEQYADILPNLEWMPSTSLHPGADHKVFWGTILPMNHPFWKAHRPGDRWNCKCSLSATDEPPTGAPPVSTDPKDQPAPGLDNNPGVDGKLFSDTHPYIADAYEGAKEAVKRFLLATFPDYAKVKVEPRHNRDEKYSERTKEIKKEARKELQGTTIEHPKLEGKIAISRRSIDEWTNQPHEHYAHKNELIFQIGNVLQKAKYLGYGKDKSTKPGSKWIHLFETKILGDKSWIIVKEYEDGNKVLYSITDSDKILQFLEKERS
ncbi:phage minor head protein [Bacteroides fluxus]|uniref:LPD3 domain-containing protein n=1 Tax=Bacteroides fluxus TaxID=626930 RepID=UPI002A838562|nr:phage minor head protein [Bacteroides fluxus]MDY3790578.1 phage minor head protein [Bacteroides fluxus]